MVRSIAIRELVDIRDGYSRSLQARALAANRMLSQSRVDIPYSTRTALFA